MIEPEQVKKIAVLARLAVDEADCEAYARDLSAILDFVATLDAAPTAEVEPLAHPLEMAQRLRADIVSEAVDRERFLANAPQSEAGLYLVPRVIE